MAEHRQPHYRIAIKGPQGRRIGELYPANLFPGGEGLDDLYRVRIDRAWHAPAGVKYAFLPLADALAVAGWPREAAPRPRLGRGDRRRLLLGRADDGTTLYEAVVVMTDPIQGPDGRWRVFLVGRRAPVLCDDLQG
ncbi:hypothetical protein [Solidesulfovibrio sp.]